MLARAIPTCRTLHPLLAFTAAARGFILMRLPAPDHLLCDAVFSGTLFATRMSLLCFGMSTDASRN